MKKWFVFIILILVLSVMMLFPETLEEILAKNYESRGGLEKLKAIKTMKINGKMVMPAQNMEFPMTIWFKKPNKMRTEATFMEKRIVTAFDGKKAWMIKPMMGSADPEELSEERSKLLTRQLDSMNPLVDYKEKGHKLEYMGKEDMEGTEVYKLKMTKKTDMVTYFYLDTESGIELKTAAYVKIGENENLVESLMGDYKEVDGIMFPFSVETKSADTGASMGPKMVFETVTLNETIEDSSFQMPPKKTPKKEEK